MKIQYEKQMYYIKIRKIAMTMNVKALTSITTEIDVCFRRRMSILSISLARDSVVNV